MIAAAAWICAAVAWAGLCVQCVNRRFFLRLYAAQPEDGIRRSVGACVAMRNEEVNARACIESLLAQPEIAAVHVCDDGSCDATPRILRELEASNDRIVLVRGGGSKRAALAAAAAAAREYDDLLFTDADVRFERGAVGALLRHRDQSDAHAVTAWPRVQTRTLVDVLFAPLVPLVLLQLLPMWRGDTGDARFAAGNGQIFLVSTSAYEACGGHSAITSLVEDVALAKRLLCIGYRVARANASGIAYCFAYGTLGASAAGFGRSLRAGGGRAGSFAFAAWQATFALPWLLLASAPLPALCAIAGSTLAYAILARTMRLHVSTPFLAPLTATVSALCSFGLALLPRQAALRWRGRVAA